MSEPLHDERHEERVDEPRDVSEVVESVNASLADAEAASREAVGEPEQTAEPAEPFVVASSTSDAEDDDAVTARYAAYDAVTERYAAEPDAATERYAAADDATALYPTAADAVTSPEIVPAEPVVPVVPVVPVAQQPIFVQAPEAPRPRGNRAAAGAIGLLAAVSYGILYLAAALGIRLASGEATVATVGQDAIAALTSLWLWVPVAVFFISFWLLGAIINRGRWGVWVILGLLIGFASYGGHLLGQLFQAPFWALTASQGAEIVESQLLAPLAIAAFVIGRELTVWFGAWVAARGKKVTELNREMQREYERTLEAGPQVRQG